MGTPMMGTHMKNFAINARDFLRSKRGNVAMMFAVALVPLMIGAGAGLDFTRAMLVRQQMAEALDAAALAIGSTTGLTQSSAQDLAQKYFNANYTVDKTEYGSPTVSIPSSGYNSTGSVVITATDAMPTVLMKLAGITSLPVTTTSNVVWGQSKLWVALVLDNSGSMSNGDSTGSKMSALQSASHQLLGILQNAASSPGDVKVGIVPFTRSINIGASSYVSSTSIDWGEWDAPPVAPGINATYAVPNTRFGNPSTISFEAWGPGDSCPFTTSSNGQMSPFGFYCLPNGTNQSNSNRISTIASSGSTKGYICPGIDSGSYNTDHNARYYNGCWTSTAGAGTVQVAKGSSATCSGFSSSNCSCSGSGSNKTCTTKKWVHTWVPNNHSTWSGCVTDRQRSGVQTMTTAGLRPAPITNYDETNMQPSGTTPDTQFPAENPSSCPGATVTTMGYDWTNLGLQIDAMSPGGSTNQAIGIEHGWQMLTTGAPYGTPSLPANTSRYIIMVSDGLNTQDRWWGNGFTEGTTQDGYIDDHEEAACDAAKADGVIIYAIYVNVGNVSGAGDSAPLAYCASDATKYYALTSNSAVVSTFNQIAQQITNVRVVK